MRPRRFRRGEVVASTTATVVSTPCFNEAPAIPPGRGHEVAPERRGLAFASMRPRRFRRGEVYRAGRRAGDEQASMRPRRFRRGEAPFEGAPKRVQARFNEAPAIPPGRDRYRLAEPLGDKPASMRPRRFRRGETGSARTEPRAPACFNEAPAIPPGRAAGLRSRPSRCGRGFNEAPAIPPGRGVHREAIPGSEHPLQ